MRFGLVASEEEKEDIEEIPAVMEFNKKELTDKLNLILQEYQDQKRGVDAKLKKLHSDMYVAILVFIIVFLVDAFFSFLLKQSGSSVLAFAWEMWAACIALFIAMWKSGINMIKKIAEYHIHNETGFLNNRKVKPGIFTLKAEGRYCEKMEKETRRLLEGVPALSTEEFQTQYAELQYIEKRADAQVFGLFDQHEVLWYIVMAIVFIIIFVVL